ncbi:MAG: RHS repeat protein, partial [Acidobacteria bacterium]|nr:RHS repeat protein [Acidobacteriota bacterium]
MFKKLQKLLASLLIVIILFPSVCFAQASQSGGGSATSQSTPGALATGAHPLGSYGGSSFDQVNLFNGNLSMSFPLAALGGRAGSGAGISLSYNSKIWRVQERRITNQLAEGLYYVPEYDHWDKERPILAPGWSFHVGRMMGRRSSYREGQTTYTLTTLTFSSPDGTEYNFRDDITDGQPLTASVIGDNQSRGKRFHTADGTAAIFVSDVEIKDKLQANGPYQPFAVDGVVVLRNGTRFVLSRGKVKEQHDSNGNIVRYSYQGSRLTQITDTLGRQINIQYVEANPNPTNQELFNINITSPGFNNSTRTTTIKFAPLANSLIGQGGSYTQAEVLKTYVNRPGIPNSGLFPDLDPPSSSNDFFNPNVIKEVTLPSGHKWNFRYNSYGEVVLVETPNLGAIEYRMEQSSGPVIAGSPNRQEIFRRISTRRIWPKAADRLAYLPPESKSTYSDPSLTDSNNIPLPVRQRTFSGENTRVASTNHYYSYSPLQNFTPGTGVPPKTGYSPWLEGKEIKTEELTLDTEQPKRVTEYTWEQRAGVSWIAGANKTFLAQPENDPRIKETTVRYLDSGQVFRTSVEYQDNIFINGVGPIGFNNVIGESVFDGNNLLRKTTRTFVTDPEYLKYTDDPNDKNIVINPHLVSLVKTESIFNPNNIEETRVEYEYDNYTRDVLLNRNFNIPTTRNPNFGFTFIKRGNLTAVTAGLGTFQTDRTTIFTQYDIAGNAVKATGPKSNQIVRTDYDSQHFAFPIANRQSIPEFFQEFKTESTYDVSTGLVTSSKDLNNQVTNYFYQDPHLLDRLTKVQRPLGSGETRYTYSAPGTYPAFIQADTSLDSGRDLSVISYVDGFLKPLQQTSKDVNNDFVSVETTYDGLGRVKKATNPHRLAASSTTDGYTTTSYDELGRISTVTTFDASNISTGTVTSTYSGTTITVTDQADKQRRSKVDALGRLTEVIEPTSNGFLSQSTTYNYDARGNLKQVNQGLQTRTFAYDSLSRLLSSTTPETGLNGSGTTSYQYDIASNLTKRTDPRGIITTYTYDTLNRLLIKDYSDTTPDATYFYDGNVPSGLAPPNFIPQFSMGRLTAVVTAATTRQEPTGLFHVYDNVGRVSKSVQLLDSRYYTTNTQYNLASLSTSHTYPSGRNVTHSYNIAGQLTDVLTNNSAISQQATYTPAGAIESHKLGNNLLHQVKYNSRLQPTQITLGTFPNIDSKWKIEYNYALYNAQNLINSTSAPFVSSNQSQNNGNIGYIRITPGLGNNPIEQFFAYDELNRLKVAKEFITPISRTSTSTSTSTSFTDYSFSPSPIYDIDNLSPFSYSPSSFFSSIDYSRANSVSSDGSNINSDFSVMSNELSSVFLAPITIANWSESYTYDRYGNRTQVDGTNSQSLSISSTTNRIISAGYTYDNAGNLTADPSGKIYTYDAENRLINVFFNPQGPVLQPESNYFYDANGWRVKKTSVLGTTRFVYNQDGSLLAEYDGGLNIPPVTSPTKENIYAPSGLLAVIEAGQTYYLTPDHLGSTRIITNSNGDVITRRDFYPFGQSINNPTDFRSSIPGYFSSSENIRQQFTGYEKDDDSGLDFAQARHMASS